MRETNVKGVAEVESVRLGSTLLMLEGMGKVLKLDAGKNDAD